MKKLLLTAVLTVSALYAISAQNIYKASYAMPHTNQAVNDNAQIQNKRMKMQIRQMQEMKYGNSELRQYTEKKRSKI